MTRFATFSTSAVAKAVQPLISPRPCRGRKYSELINRRWVLLAHAPTMGPIIFAFGARRNTSFWDLRATISLRASKYWNTLKDGKNSQRDLRRPVRGTFSFHFQRVE